MKKLMSSLKYIKLYDILSIFIFILCLLPSLCLKLYHKITKKTLWLICENKDTARDNSYHLFKYIRKNYPSENIYYAIDKTSNDYKKIKAYGNIISFGSLKHWIYYMAADKNISTQKSGNPSPSLFYVLHVCLNLYNNRVFLQHGITINDSQWLYYKNTKFKTFICGAKKEYEYIKEKFGYPKKNLHYSGFPRFDNLTKEKLNKKQIVLMPTWRSWLGRQTNALETKQNFTETEYFKRYNSLINNQKVIDVLEKQNIILYFYPHRNMQKFAKNFKTPSKNIIVIENNEVDIQDLLMESSLMITDYSSVSMDFAYMKKPVIYYQFDKEKYQKNQLQEGYFSYEEDGFGKVLNDEEKVVAEMINQIQNNYHIEDKYLKRINNFFEINDQDNCKRVYEILKEK